MARARFKGYLEWDLVLRVLGVLFLVFSTLFYTPTLRVYGELSAEGEPSEQSSGVVAGAEETESENSGPQWPKLRNDALPFPTLTAEAVLVKDGKTGKILFEKNSSRKMHPASLTKIMTAVVSLDKYAIDEEFLVSESCLSGLAGKAQMSLQAGDRISAGSLLYGVLLQSAADAACVLARNPATVLDDSRSAEHLFIEEMNRKAWELGMLNTNFENAIGVDEDGHYSTAEDLMLLVQTAMEDALFRRIVGTEEINLQNATNPPTRWYRIHNTNDLLVPDLPVTGVKTGTTDSAGECLIISWLWEDREVYAVLLGSDKDLRFGEMQQIMDWVSKSFVPRSSSD